MILSKPKPVNAADSVLTVLRSAAVSHPLAPTPPWEDWGEEMADTSDFYAHCNLDHFEVGNTQSRLAKSWVSVKTAVNRHKVSNKMFQWY